jgi:protein-tyrosine phosphatase
MKILMVCLGNICRSPLAHGIMEDLVKQKGLNWEIDSAGTGGWHVGQPPDIRSIRIAKKYGLDISKQSCRKFDVVDFENFDQILVMDYNNMKDVRALARNEEEQNKISLFMKDAIVPDPYYDDDQFDPVYQMIDKRCREFLDEFASSI